MQPYAKHQQHHADLRQLACQGRIGDKTRSERADGHPRQQIPHQGWQPQTGGQKAQHQRQAQGGSNGVDQRDAVWHGQMLQRAGKNGGMTRL